MSRPRLPRPTDAELQILNLIWEGKKTVREVYTVLHKIRGNGYNSVLKLMQIMTAKKLVTVKVNVRPQEYTASKTKEEIQKLLILDLANRAFGGNTLLMLDSILMINKQAKRTKKK